MASADTVKTRFMLIGSRQLVWVKRAELREHFNIVWLDPGSAQPERRGIIDMFGELHEGVIVELKNDSTFEDLPHDVRFELFLFKKMNKDGPAMFALEYITGVRFPDHLEEENESAE